jgi:hypothetical protein
MGRIVLKLTVYWEVLAMRVLSQYVMEISLLAVGSALQRILGLDEAWVLSWTLPSSSQAGSLGSRKQPAAGAGEVAAQPGG